MSADKNNSTAGLAPRPHHLLRVSASHPAVTPHYCPLTATAAALRTEHQLKTIQRHQQQIINKKPLLYNHTKSMQRLKKNTNMYT